MEIDEELDTEHSESFYSPFEDDFEQTIALLELDVDEVQVEVEQALEEVEGKKQFPCDFCVKVCKSKGGLTRHQRSKHVAELGEGSSIQSDIPLISEEKVCDLIRDIGRHLVDEKLYRKEHTAEVFKLQPSKSFVTFANQLLVKFKRRSNQDKLLKEFYGSTNSNWREYFHPCDNKKVVFLMLIHLPERLIGLLKERQDDQGLSDSKEELTPQEYGPLAYLAGYVIRSLYQKSKNCSRSKSSRNKEIQALMSSMRVETEANEYVSSLSRGGLWSPHSWVISIAEMSELVFRKYTSKKERLTCLPVDAIVNEVINSPLVINMWCNIVQNCDMETSKECQTLCLENVVKLYVTVRCFSFAKDIVNKYKLSQGTQKKKALRKDMKIASEECE